MAVRPALPADFVALLQAFVDAEVRFLVIGGYAVGVHDRPRTTKDLDLFVDSKPANLERAVLALREFGAPAAVIADFVTAGPDEIVWMGAPPIRVDLLKGIPGVTFAGAWARRVTVEWRDVTVPVISRADLIAAKRAADRPRDRLDVINLERAAKSLRRATHRPARKKRRPRSTRKR